jgi:transcriptional regulator with XRE-family HTH domain
MTTVHSNQMQSQVRRRSAPLAGVQPPRPATRNFGERLARLRKAAGYTQHQLAAEIGSTRRKIAYHESESEHPPAHLLAELARALNVSIDELLGVSERRKATRAGPVSPRLERRMRQIETLAPRAKQQLIGLIDTFLTAERARQRAKP